MWTFELKYCNTGYPPFKPEPIAQSPGSEKLKPVYSSWSWATAVAPPVTLVNVPPPELFETPVAKIVLSQWASVILQSASSMVDVIDAIVTVPALYTL